MIEIICREKQQEEQEIKPPKNIRQVGSPKGRHKIYMEDYVYTYLRNQAQASRKCAAVLLGKSCVSRDIRYTFISGAIECGQAVFQFDSIYLDESFWEYIYSEGKEYFPDAMIVGWFVGEQGEGMNLSATIESAHRKYFAGRDKVLMLMDVEEEEELFYIYEQGYLQKREGYYVYYEKNIAMQEYMIRKKEEQHQIEPVLPEEEEPLWKCPESDEIPEEAPQEAEEKEPFPTVQEKDSEWESLHKEIREETIEEQKTPVSEKIFVKSSMEEPVSEAEKALQNYRHAMLEKRGHKVERQNKRFLYTAASFFMIAFCVVGITTINNYRKMQEVEDVLYVMKGETEKKIPSDLVVESVESGVTPIEEQGQQDNQTQNTQEQSTEQQQSTQQQSIEQQSTEQQSVEQQQEVAPQQPATTETQPTATPDAQQPTAPQQSEPQYYTVQAGDTLESICLKIYQDKSKVAALCQANGIENGNQIQAGQKLILP